MTRSGRAAQESTHPTRRVLLRQMAVLLGGAALGRPAFSQETPPAKAEEKGPLKSDPAFAAVVSVEAYYVTVAQIIKQITPPDFSYTLRVAPFDAETPLHLCVKNKPLGDVLQMCAALLNGQWREEKATGSFHTVYVLEPKPDTIAREKALYLATLDLNAEPMMQTARLAARHSLSYWQKEYQKVKTVPGTRAESTVENRLLQSIAHPYGNGLAFFTLFASLSRTQQRTLTNDSYLVLPWNAMNATQKQSALASRHSETRIAPHSADDMTPEQNRAAEQKERDSIQRFGVIASVDKAPGSGRIIICRLGTGANQGYREVRIPDPAPPSILPIRGNPHLFDIDAATAVTTNTDVAQVPSVPVKPKEETKTSPEAALEKPFPTGITFTKTDTWADVVQTLAQKLPFAIVSDAYTAARWCKFPPSEAGVTIAGDLDKMTVAQALDALCTAHNYLWWYEPGKNDTQGTLFFRSRAWFVEKRYEPPAWAAAKATAALQGVEKRGESGAVVDSVVGLTIEQLQGIAARRWASPYGGTSWILKISFMQGSGWNSACSAFYWLRFWSHLPPEQKQLMKSPDGLPGNALDEVQKNELLQGLFASSSLHVPLSEAAATSWEKARLHVWYEEKQATQFLPENAPSWKPTDLRPADLYFAITGAQIAYGSPLALPVALAPPPQPQKTKAAK